MKQVSSELGTRLRALRNERGHSLARVAQSTNISKSFLVLVEGGKSDITITRLMRLAQFYGVQIGDVLPEAPDNDATVVRRGEGQRVSSSSEKMEVSLLAKYTGRAMSPVIARLAPGGESEQSSHPGEEFFYVLSGRFSLRVEGDEPVLLEAGDSAYFAGERPHSFRNVGASEGEVISTVTPAIF